MGEGHDLKIVFISGAVAHGALALLSLIATAFMGYYYNRRGRGLATMFNLALLALLYASFYYPDWSVGALQRADSIEVWWMRPILTGWLLFNLGMVFAKFCNLGASAHKIFKLCAGMAWLFIILADLFYQFGYWMPWGFAIGAFTASWMVALYHSRSSKADATINWLGVSRAVFMWIGYGLFGYALLITQLLSFSMMEVLDTAPHRLNTEIMYLVVCGAGSVLALVAQLLQPDRASLYSKNE